MNDEFKPAQYAFNRQSGEVSFPEAGEGGFLLFDVKAFEVLFAAYGEEYIERIIKSLAKMDVKTYQTVIAATLRGTTNDGGAPWGLKWMEINVRILDALNLSIYGKTYEEQKEANEQEMLKRLQDVEANPQMAAILQLLSSTSAGKPESEQA